MRDGPVLDRRELDRGHARRGEHARRGLVAHAAAQREGRLHAQRRGRADEAAQPRAAPLGRERAAELLLFGRREALVRGLRENIENVGRGG